MRRTLLRSPAFARDLRNWLKSHPDGALPIEAALEQLSADAAHSSLRTRRLQGSSAHSSPPACEAQGGQPDLNEAGSRRPFQPLPSLPLRPWYWRRSDRRAYSPLLSVSAHYLPSNRGKNARVSTQ